MILDDTQFKISLEGSWIGPAYDVNNPQSMNEVLRHTFGSPANTYEGGFLDWRNDYNMYISSHNLGSCSTLGPRGECKLVQTNTSASC